MLFSGAVFSAVERGKRDVKRGSGLRMPPSGKTLTSLRKFTDDESRSSIKVTGMNTKRSEKEERDGSKLFTQRVEKSKFIDFKRKPSSKSRTITVENTFTDLHTEMIEDMSKEEYIYIRPPAASKNSLIPFHEISDEENDRPPCFKSPKLSERALLYKDSLKIPSPFSPGNPNSELSEGNRGPVSSNPVQEEETRLRSMRSMASYRGNGDTNRSHNVPKDNRSLKSMRSAVFKAENEIEECVDRLKSMRSAIFKAEEELGQNIVGEQLTARSNLNDHNQYNNQYSMAEEENREQRKSLLESKRDGGKGHIKTIDDPVKMTPIVRKWQKVIRKVILVNKFQALNKELHSVGRTLTPEKLRPKFIILPDSGLRFFWSIMLLFALAFTGIYVPIRLAFMERVQLGFVILEFFVDFIFFCDIFANFLTAYHDEEHKLITDRTKIAIKYIKGWFLIDLLALFPFWLFDNDEGGQSMNYNKLLRLLRLSRLYRILRLLNVVRIFDFLQQNKTYEKILITMKMNSGIKRLIKAVFTYFIICHLFACFWFYTARYNSFNPETWVVRYAMRDLTVGAQYLVSFSWVVTLSTIGYADLFPYTKTERTVSMIYIIAGVTFVSYSIGTLSSILLSSDSKMQNLKKRLLVLDELALSLRMDTNLYYRLKHILRSNHETQFYSDMNYDSLLDELPSTLRAQLITLIYNENKLDTIRFFENKHPNFLNAILPLLKRVSIEKNEVIYNDGDLADEMYFLLEGRVRFVSPDNYIFRIMSYGGYLGQGELFNKEDYRMHTAIAVEDCKLLVLKRTDFLVLQENYMEEINELARESRLIEAQNKDFLIQARFADARLENQMQNTLTLERQKSMYNRDFAFLARKESPRDMNNSLNKSQKSVLSSIYETIQDTSESDLDSTSNVDKTQKSKIEWEEKSEELDCSETYSKSSCAEGKIEPARKYSNHKPKKTKKRSLSIQSPNIRYSSVIHNFQEEVEGKKVRRTLVPKLELPGSIRAGLKSPPRIEVQTIQGKEQLKEEDFEIEEANRRRFFRRAEGTNNLRRNSMPLNPNTFDSTNVLKSKISIPMAERRRPSMDKPRYSVVESGRYKNLQALRRPSVQIGDRHQNWEFVDAPTTQWIVKRKPRNSAAPDLGFHYNHARPLEDQHFLPSPPKDTKDTNHTKIPIDRRVSRDIFPVANRRTSILHSMAWQKELSKKNKF